MTVGKRDHGTHEHWSSTNGAKTRKQARTSTTQAAITIIIVIIIIYI